MDGNSHAEFWASRVEQAGVAAGLVVNVKAGANERA